MTYTMDEAVGNITEAFRRPDGLWEDTPCWFSPRVGSTWLQYIYCLFIVSLFICSRSVPWSYSTLPITTHRVFIHPCLPDTSALQTVILPILISIRQRRNESTWGVKLSLERTEIQPVGRRDTRRGVCQWPRHAPTRGDQPRPAPCIGLVPDPGQTGWGQHGGNGTGRPRCLGHTEVNQGIMIVPRACWVSESETKRKCRKPGNERQSAGKAFSSIRWELGIDCGYKICEKAWWRNSITRVPVCEDTKRIHHAENQGGDVTSKLYTRSLSHGCIINDIHACMLRVLGISLTGNETSSRAVCPSPSRWFD